MSIFWEIAVYELLDIIPFALLVVAPLKVYLRSRRALWLAIGVLYCVGIVRRSVVFQIPEAAAGLSLLWVLLYVTACYFVLRVALPKFLFVLITVLNYASLLTIFYNYIAHQLFEARLASNPFGLEASLVLAAILFPSFPLAHRFLTKMVAPLIASDENASMWSYLWLVPATFCVFFYFNLYVGNGILGFSQDMKNVVFSIVIGAGSFFVLILVLQLVRESNLTLHLQAQNHQLSLDTLRYQSMKERIDEARRARHDLRQCMAVLQGFLQNGDAEGLRAYVRQVCEAMPPDAPHIRCGHPAADALFGYYEEQAAAQKTEFSIQTDDLRHIEMQDTDLIVLLGNLLENAVEACARQKAGARFIRLRIREQGDAWIIALDNSCDTPLLRDENGVHSSKRPGNGIGIVSIERIVRKYHGVANFQSDGKEFRVSLLLQPEPPSGVPSA